MRKRYACEFYGNMEVYLATEVEAHLTALQAQHAEAMAEKDREIEGLKKMVLRSLEIAER